MRPSSRIHRLFYPRHCTVELFRRSLIASTNIRVNTSSREGNHRAQDRHLPLDLPVVTLQAIVVQLQLRGDQNRRPRQTLLPDKGGCMAIEHTTATAVVRTVLPRLGTHRGVPA